MRNTPIATALVGAALAAMMAVSPARADQPPKPKPHEERVREIFVPFDDLAVLLEGPIQRVLLPRELYDDLVSRARKQAETRPPRPALVASADYTVTVGDERAELAAAISVTVLDDGLHAVGLDVAGVGIRTATLDGKPAPLGLADDGRLTLFVEGKGPHTLALDMVAPVQTTAARQILNFRLPASAAARMKMTVPGDVEVKSGAAVAQRVFDQQAGVTRFELLPQKGDTSLVMTLNSRLRRRDKVVVARSVLVDEVTAAYERLHCTFSMAVLHRAVDQFRFAVPDGFEVTDVRSPHIARWGQTTEGGRRLLDVHLREETTETVVLAISALRTGPDLKAWRLPLLEPLEVVGHVAVVGLVVEDRLKAEAIQTQGLIPIDTSVLASAIPPTVLEAQPGAVRLRPVAAYYAPQQSFGLSATFLRPTPQVRAVANVLAILTDGGVEVRGGFSLVPEEERLFAFDFSVPAGWQVTTVAGEGEERLSFERYGGPGEVGRIHVRLPGGVPPGSERRAYFTARHVPREWFSEWTVQTIELPVFAVAGVACQEGAIAVDARDDMTVRPEWLEGLTPLDENEKARYGLGATAASLAWRYDAQPYKARLAVERAAARLTAQTFSFFRIDREALAAHYEVVFDVARARVGRLSVTLPADTPEAVSIRGLGDVRVKQYAAEVLPATPGQTPRRRWTALLADRRSGPVRLAVDFERPLPTDRPADLVLPVILADGVAYQSGLVAIEGSPELDIRVTAHPRKVDIGELAEAEYQPGRRLLGAYGFLGHPPPLKVGLSRQPLCGLPPAIVQRAELATVLSADRVAQTAARFLLRTKALFAEVRLPEGSTLWSAVLDGKPVKPHTDRGSLLVNLPAGPAGAVRDLQVVYESSAGRLGFWRNIEAAAPRLLLHAAAGAQPEEVPVADLEWLLYMPTGYRIVRAEGTMVTHDVEPPPLAVANVAAALYHGTGGVAFSHGAVALLTFPLLGGGMSALPSTVQRLAERRHQRGGAGGEAFYVARGEDREAATADLLTEGKVAEESTRGQRTSQPGANRAGEAGVPLADVTAGAEPAGPAGQPSAKPVAGRADSPSPAAPAERPPGHRKELAKAKADWALEGVASLKIDIQRTGEPVKFHSLGAEPALVLTVIDDGRTAALAWGLALVVIVVGLALTGRSAARKAAWVVGVTLVATLAPVVTGRIELALITNGSVYAACLLVPYYLVAGAVRWLTGKVRRFAGGAAATTAAVAVVVVLAASALGGTDEKAPAAGPYVVQIVPPPPPVRVPDDALIMPYDPGAGAGVPQADRVLVPYDKYVELWNAAYPDQAIAARRAPADYALAGADMSAVLKGDEYLLVEGRIEIDVYTDGYATIPLPLEGGVLARADLDGKPARASAVQVEPAAAQAKDSAPPAQNASPAAPPRQTPSGSFIVIYASGKGRHRLDVAVRLRLGRQGGWRVAQGALPAAPSTALTLTVPEAGTEVRLGGVPDRQTYETAAPGQTIRTSLGAHGRVAIQWRPKVAEGQIDQTLTAESSALFDVQEDALRLVWALHLDFRHGERDFFAVEVPTGYLVEKVEGTNVRGWEVKAAAGGAAAGILEVALLKRTRGAEDFTVTLSRGAWAGPPSQPTEFDVPVVGVTGAARHTGRLVIRRSPLLDVRTVTASGVTRADLPPESGRAAAEAGPTDSPLGIRPYQAYQFQAAPFVVRLSAAPVEPKTSAVVRMVLKISERERRLEVCTLYTVENRPMYRARIVVPDDLKVERVMGPGSLEWALVSEAGRKVLTVYLAAGVEGVRPIVIHGKLGADGPVQETSVPRVEVLDVVRQEGDLVVQADPALDVRAEGLANIERVLLERVLDWLQGPQRSLARLAMHWSRPDYSGRLVLEARRTDASCLTVTNARVTDRAVQETVLVHWTIRGAGLREVSIILPPWMKDARVSVPLLRQKTVSAVSADDPASPVRVRLELQDEVIDELKVLVEHDRLLSGEVHEVAIPVVETGRTDRRYVALESAGRDEVVVEQKEGLEPLGRQQKEWAAVAGLLRGGTTQAFIVAEGAARPKLAFGLRQREAVETVGARIGLAQTLLVMDRAGAYRGEQVYRLDNRTEQFLEVELPEGASLWAAVVAGQAVKPTLVGQGAPGRRVRIPLIKTAAGDLDYAVVLKYGGCTEPLGNLRLAVKFPIIRTVNVNVELSQVRLFVPETHAWLWWRGTTRRVTEEGEIEAGLLAYQNKMADRLVQTIRSSNPFAQARAAYNLKSLKDSIQTFQQSAGALGGSAALLSELSNSAVILESAEREIQDQARAGQQQQADNNDIIRQAYAGQRNRRARNLVNDLGANWADVPQTAPTDRRQTDAAGKFNKKWLESNRLEVAEADRYKMTPDGQRLDFLASGRQVAQPAPQQAGAEQMFKKLSMADGKAQVETRAAEQQQRRGGVDELVQRYQQKLQQRAQADEEVVERDEKAEKVPSSSARGRGWGESIGFGYGMAAEAQHAAPDAGPLPPAGLASLDVELPERGLQYRFTTPRGEVEIVASAVSEPLIDGLGRVGGAGALVIAVWLVRRRLRGRPVTLQTQATLSTVLIVLGIIGLAVGVLPVAGLVSAAVGVAMKVRLFFAHRRFAQTGAA